MQFFSSGDTRQVLIGRGCAVNLSDNQNPLEEYQIVWSWLCPARGADSEWKNNFNFFRVTIQRSHIPAVSAFLLVAVVDWSPPPPPPNYPDPPPNHSHTGTCQCHPNSHYTGLSLRKNQLHLLFNPQQHLQLCRHAAINNKNSSSNHNPISPSPYSCLQPTGT